MVFACDFLTTFVLRPALSFTGRSLTASLAVELVAPFFLVVEDFLVTRPLSAPLLMESA